VTLAARFASPFTGAAAVEAGGAERSGVGGLCAHCGQPTPLGRRFCCPGCEAAFETIRTLGLGRYYEQRVLDPSMRAPRPAAEQPRDLTRFTATRADGTHELTLAVDGLQCGACVWLIESILGREPAVESGRINMTSRRLKLVWRGEARLAADLVARVEALGYRLMPFDAQTLAAASDQVGRKLIRALAVAGFAAGNVMLISIGVWAGAAAGWLDSMGPATRTLLHWVSALIALPAIAYAGMPFFASAAAALRQRHANMDVPISVGVVLVAMMSLAETLNHGPHTYFDSAITLLFFLLIGRVLDHRARGQARATAEQLLTLRASDAAVLQPDGSVARRPQQSIGVGDRVLVGLGEAVSADGVVERGASSLDTSLVTGESLPLSVAPGCRVFAGTLNLGEPLVIRATATGGATLLAECVRLIEAAESRRTRFVVLADRVARRYAPAVHLAALLTFAYWYFAGGLTLSGALLIASAVLIITCPCALALAVPAVQVIATSRLFRKGVLLKSPTALERLAEVDTVVFDKTGTLSEPDLGLIMDDLDPEALRQAAAIAASSRHPLARALVEAAGTVPAAEGVIEVPGQGLHWRDWRLGSRAFAHATGNPAEPQGAPRQGALRQGALTQEAPRQEAPRQEAPRQGAPGQAAPRPTEASDAAGNAASACLDSAGCKGNVASVIAEAATPRRDTWPGADRPADDEPWAPELWLIGPGRAATRFTFKERPRRDAAEIVPRLRDLGLQVHLISGDRTAAVRRMAEAVGITEWHAAKTPVEKVAFIEALAAGGHRVLMVGDGLNDSPSLAAAHVSASPSSAADISQTVADVVFQGALLAPVAQVIETARRARSVMGQNLALSIGYNLLMVPLAVAGWVTPWLAAAAMSSSSLLVIANSFRAGGRT